MRQVEAPASPPVLGPVPVADGVFFRVWAPRAHKVAVRQVAAKGLTTELRPEKNNYFSGFVPGMAAGDLYTYLLDNTLERPDPASRCQPQGVHGPSLILPPSRHLWQDSAWQGLHLRDFIIYELHVGTFSPEGTFAGVEQRLPYLCELGITAVEIMPVAQFPGERNWGYDGVYPYAVQTSYGGTEALKSLVDACHRHGLAVILDVVYNHVGPEGNYFHDFGPYFTDRYRTPWGAAVNFDGPESDGVRDYFIGNALFWIDEYHIDALRLDAVHTIFDFSAHHILDELGQAVHQLAATAARQIYIIAESDLNDSRLVRSHPEGGYNLDAQWNDDFHHALHALLTGERDGYYQDFGEFEQLYTAFKDGFVYAGSYSHYRQRRHGNNAGDLDPWHLVVSAQNHDQVGNRQDGDRLAGQLDLQQLKLIAGTVLLSPFLPLLFMGEEYGDTAPFQYFISHSDEELVNAVRNGRQQEFSNFEWQAAIPDPQSKNTFLASRIDIGLKEHNQHQLLYSFYCRLIALRKKHPCLATARRQDCLVSRAGVEPLLFLTRKNNNDHAVCIFNFGTMPLAIDLPWPGVWQLLLDSAASEEDKAVVLHQQDSRPKEGIQYISNPLSVVVFLAGDQALDINAQCPIIIGPYP